MQATKDRKKPLILVTNDDGVLAPGIRTLISVMSEIGQVVVVAPDKPQSAMGHAITINNTLYLNKISEENAAVVEYSCSGTPVDCVKLAVNEILHQKPMPYTLWVYGKKAKDFKKGGVGEKIQELLK